MKSIWLLIFNFCLFFSPVNSHFFNYQICFSPVNFYEKNDDYIYNETEIIKKFYQPLGFEKESSEGTLFSPGYYNTKIQLKLPDYDLSLIKKEILKVNLVFDFELNWVGVQQGPKHLNSHLLKPLIDPSFNTDLDCGEIGWDSIFYPNLKIKHLISFSWLNQELVLENKTNLTDNQIFYLTFSEDQGLAKMSLKISNLQLVYEIPRLFKEIATIKLNLDYVISLETIKNIDSQLEKKIWKNQQLQELEFTKYLKFPLLDLAQKETLLNVQPNFIGSLQINLQLQPQYNEKILAPLLDKIYFNLDYFQSVDLTKLCLVKEIKIHQYENAIDYFLDKNSHYDFFLQKYCDFEIADNFLFVKTKREYSNLQGSLKLEITYDSDVDEKKNLEDLNLVQNLGTFELKNEDELVTSKLIFDCWKTKNSLILKNEKIQDYSINNLDFNSSWINAKLENPNYYGSCYVFYQVKYLNHEKRDLNLLGLKLNLGLIIDSQTAWEKIVLGKFLNLNQNELQELNPNYYESQIDLKANQSLILAKDENPYYFGSVTITFKIVEQEKPNETSDHYQKTQSFWKQYWWVITLASLFTIFVLFMFFKFWQTRRQKNSKN